MPASEAQILANRKNSEKSTGPKTVEGKARSRANSFKHGLTGQSVVVPEEDQAEVDRRSDEFESEFQPRTGSGRFLVRRAAAISVRLDRSVRHEFAAVAERVRNAPGEFEEAHRLEVDRLMAGLLNDPIGSSRQLRQSHEGIDALTVELTQLRGILMGNGPGIWSLDHADRLERLMGINPQSQPHSRLKALGKAVCLGHSHHRGERSEANQEPSSRDQIAQTIDLELAQLRELRNAIDLESIGKNWSESSIRAQFDTSKPAQLARKYEAASERSFFRCLQEFRKVEAEVVEEVESPEPELASSFPETPSEPVELPFEIPQEYLDLLASEEFPVAELSVEERNEIRSSSRYKMLVAGR